MSLKGYKVVLLRRANKGLSKIDKKNVKAILNKLDLLVTSEKKLDVKKIVDRKNLYRLKSGNYRIVYTIYKQKVVVLVVDIGHRKEIYKNLAW